MKVETNFPPFERVLDISVIVPVLDRDDGAEQVWRLYRDVLVETGRSFEFIFVLDGAHPAYASALERIAAGDERVHVIALNRPFGEAACVQEGTRHARGETLLLMPAYLQVSPESIRLLLDESAAADVVAGVRDRHKDKPISRLRGWWFNALACSTSCSCRTISNSSCRSSPSGWAFRFARCCCRRPTPIGVSGRIGRPTIFAASWISSRSPS
jgi:glycosyltransferase involved in cell wall biosynthesis